jgi:ribosome-binding protein aMBF1 (putative translation factor)
MKASHLRLVRLQAGINRQSELSAELGWNTETITDIERGRVGIDSETQTEILDAIERIRIRKREAEQCREVATAV